MLDENLKNNDGESNLEVRKRMLESVYEILNNHEGKRIAIVSHGAAIKYFLQNWCKYDKNSEMLIFNNDVVCHRKLESPSVIKMKLKDNILIEIEKC